MPVLHHHAFCPHSRFVRLSLGELGMVPEIAEERPWERDTRFLLMSPAGATPVLRDERVTIPGASPIAEYLDETAPVPDARRLMPADPAGRAEVRRLVEWFNVKFHEEVTGLIVHEKVFKRLMNPAQGGGSPDAAAIRAARANVRYHLRYIGYLIGHRNWLAGPRLTYADLAAAAHLSCADYFGDVPWDEDETAKDWYARVKSRPTFRTLLADRVAGLGPSRTYADLDF